jgi:mono/diheme cytochrome c family protein
MKKLHFIFLIMLGGCYYDNEEMLYPDSLSACDTTNVTYAGTVFPIISSNCISCHSGNAPQGNILLEDYTTVSAQAKIPAGQPGSLYGAISHASGNSAMPKDGTKLSDCDLLKVKTWIDAGTPKN